MPGPANSLNITQAGVVVFDGVSNFLGRTLTPGNGITITNGNGISGNPTIALTGNGPAIEHLTGDSGGVLNPDGLNNFNLLGQQAGTVAVMDTIGSGSTISFENRSWLTQLVVDPSTTAGLRGTFTTITLALAAAVSGQTIFVRPGTYTENITLKAGVNITGWQSDGSVDLVAATSNVTIVGTVTMTVAGTAVLSGLRLQTNSAALLAVTGTAASIVYLKNCYLNCSNNSGITASSTLGEIHILGCSGNLGTTGINYFAMTNGTNVTIDGGLWGNSGNSTTASTWTNGVLIIKNCDFNSFLSSSGASGGSANIYNVFFNASSLNTTPITQNGTGSSMSVWNCFVDAGTASAISVGAGATLNLWQSQIKSSNTNAITGGGSINYSVIEFVGTSVTNNVTTQTIKDSSAFQKVVVQTFTTGTSTYTPTAGMKYCVVELQGCGGGGGGSATCSGTQTSAGAGGAAGGYTRKAFTAATIGSSQTVTIGAVGTAGAVGAGTGGTGTASTFGALLTANGGVGGNAAGAGSTPQTAQGGGGGTSSGGDFNATGGAGGNAFSMGGATGASSGGLGGASYFGSGGQSGQGTQAGSAGTAYGGGGGGASVIASGTQQAGGAGGAGICIVTEYL